MTFLLSSLTRPATQSNITYTNQQVLTFYTCWFMLWVYLVWSLTETRLLLHLALLTNLLLSHFTYSNLFSSSSQTFGLDYSSTGATELMNTKQMLLLQRKAGIVNLSMLSWSCLLRMMITLLPIVYLQLWTSLILISTRESLHWTIWIKENMKITKTRWKFKSTILVLLSLYFQIN